MRVRDAGLVVVTALPSFTSAMLVASGSPCYLNCGNVLTNTTGTDMVCSESAISNSVFQTCINCEMSSTYSSKGQTDLQWLLYNLRYALSWCLWGDPNNNAVGDSPCLTSTACGPLMEAVEWNNLTTKVGSYDFCQSWISTQVPKCSACLLAGENNFLNNYLTMLDAACLQKPTPRSTLSIQGSPFSTVPVNITTPTPSPLFTVTPDNSPISLPGKVGIAVAGIVILLALVGCGIVCNGRRRRRSFLRNLRNEHGHKGWPTPNGNGNGNDMFETPVSQKPLRGWEDSPVSAVTDNTFPRYFSPYSSQYNSPVSAIEGPSTMPWPTTWPAAGRSPQSPHPEGLAPPPTIEIGIALGGSDPSLRTQPSNQSMQSSQDQKWGFKEKEKDNRYGNEAYELHEVDSNGSLRRPMQSAAPVLQHPGYGRNHTPPQSRGYGGLTEEDAKRGKAL